MYNGRMLKNMGRNGAGNNHHKIVYFDSNDEMVCGSEVSEDELNITPINGKIGNGHSSSNRNNGNTGGG